MRMSFKHAKVIEFARLHYKENKTQDEIAKIFKVSRATVSRGLKLAHSIGAVQIRVINPYSDFSAISEAIKERFNLKRVLIAPAIGESDENKKREIGYVAADLFESIVKADSIVGVTWGSTVAALAAALQPQEPVRVKFVQMLGAGGSVVARAHINEVTRRMAEAFRSDWFVLPAPAIVDNISLRDALVAEELVATVLDMCRQAEIALVGVGTPDRHSGAVTLGHMSPDDLALVKNKGAVGEICYKFFDVEGKPCETEIEGRVIGIDLDDLLSIPIRIGVAGGENKVEAILGALRGGYVNMLVTDEITAGSLLRYDT